MGLDMYLYARSTASEGTAMHKVIEENITEEQAKEMNHYYDDGSGGELYVSGWDFSGFKNPGRKPEALYEAICMEQGYSAHKGSPHINLRQTEGGIYEIDTTIFYWRKANAIHKWFVAGPQQGVDECQMTYVHPEALMDLLERCEEVTLDHKKCHDLLPTVGGFFFGSTEYDEWYFDEVKETATDLKAQMSLVAPGTQFFYRSSW